MVERKCANMLKSENILSNPARKAFRLSLPKLNLLTGVTLGVPNFSAPGHRRIQLNHESEVTDLVSR